MITIRNFHPQDERFLAIQQRGEAQDRQIRADVETIIADVRKRGDEALIAHTERFDGVRLIAERLRVTAEEMSAAQEKVEHDFLAALALARVNIRRFHEYQRRQGYMHDDGEGVRLTKRVVPLRRIGVYCPAGAAPLFSSLLMNVIPAQIAGVREIAVATPPRRDGSIDPHILATARLLGITEIYRIGGSQAIAAMAYGTDTIRRVDKIVGPGNAYVAMAKRLVFGVCGIDTPAGPSEVAIIADQTARPAYVAADLLSQLEHGSGYEIAALFTTSRDLAMAVAVEAERRMARLANAAALGRALDQATIFICANLFAAVEAVNLLAPEHLEIMAMEAESLLAEIENAGAVFLGPFSTEAIGDYFAGSNHVLPTAGAARFASSLSVADFVKDITVVEYTADRLRQTGRHIIRLAECEGMYAHADAIRARLESL